MIYSLIVFSLLIKTLYKKLPIVWLLSLSFIISFLPIYSGNTLNFYFTGLFSQLSIISVIFYIYWLFDWRIALDQKKAVHFKLGLLILGVFVLGFHFASNQYSFYHFGYAHLYLLFAVFITLCTAIFFKYWFVFFCLSLVLICFITQSLESQNLFDYLIDPFLLLVIPFTFWRKTHEA